MPDAYISKVFEIYFSSMRRIPENAKYFIKHPCLLESKPYFLHNLFYDQLISQTLRYFNLVIYIERDAEKCLDSEIKSHLRLRDVSDKDLATFREAYLKTHTSTFLHAQQIATKENLKNKLYRISYEDLMMDPNKFIHDYSSLIMLRSIH